MALELKLQSVVENKSIALDGTETVTTYDISVYVATDTAPDKILASKAVSIEGNQSAEDSKTELKDKIRSWWESGLAEYNRKVNLRSIASTAITELLAE